MPAGTVTFEHLLKPISAEEPAGADLRFSSEWKKLEEARRFDDELDQGSWQFERKTANWPQVLELSSRLLEDKSKDLRLAMFLVEAKVRTKGFQGLAEGIRFTGDLLREFWDRGLHPLPERLPDGKDSFADRAIAMAWLNDKLADVVSAIPITFASPPAQNYSYARYLSAREAGWEKNHQADAAEKRESFEAAKREGLILDLYDEAVRASSSEAYQGLLDDLQSVVGELNRLRESSKEKFQKPDEPPVFSRSQAVLEEIATLVKIHLKDRKKAPASTAPELRPTSSAATSDHGAGNGPLPSSATAADLGAADLGGSWAEAQAMVVSGQVDQGLARMAMLAQKETSGRSRFQRKLLLAEVCLKSRPRLARTILEELAEQIDNYKLDEWESTDIVGKVWMLLYRIDLDSGETEKATQLYNRLCRLDPWQTMSCSEE